MRIGGFVIHGNSAGTLGRCLDGLVAVCDEVLAIDSESRDGSRELCAARGVRSIVHPWQGYGAARAAAVGALRGCNYLLYLDSDEWLEAPAIEAVRRWRRGPAGLPHYTVRRRDWVEAGDRRFIFRSETRARLVRVDCGVWQPSWIVHEALPRRPCAPLGAFVEHHFAREPGEIREKQAVYAFLWAVRAHAEGRRPSSSAGRALASVVRDALVKGALWRGGLLGWEMARAVAAYHALKYEYLRAVGAGSFPAATEAFQEGRYGELFAMTRAGAPPLPGAR